MDTVYAYTRRPLHTIRDSASMLEACRLMRDHQIRHLIVLDAVGKLTGVLSDRDVQRSIHQKRVNDFELDQRIADEERVSDYMSWPVCTVSDTTSLLKVARDMLEQKVSSMVIVNKYDDALGIVTTDDLLKIFIQDREKFCPKKEITSRFRSFFDPSKAHLKT